MPSKRKSNIFPQSYLQAQFVKTIEPYLTFSKIPLKPFSIEFRPQESKAV